MTKQEQADLMYDFSFQTGLKVEVKLIYSDVMIIPALQQFNVVHLKSIAYWIEDRFTEVGRFTHQLPTLTQDLRDDFCIRLSQAQALKMLSKKKVDKILGKV